MFRKLFFHLPLKVIVGYVTLILLSLYIGYRLYDDYREFSRADDTAAQSSRKAFLLSDLLNSISAIERLSRTTAYADSPTAFKRYSARTDSLMGKITQAKEEFRDIGDAALLDSISVLLQQKMENVRNLQEIRHRYLLEDDVKSAIRNISQLEDRYRKLKIGDLVANPEDLGSRQRRAINEYIEYLNQNIPDDSTNTISKKQMDSVLTSSKRLLDQVRLATESQKKSFEKEEKKLLRNESVISEKIGRIIDDVQASLETYLATRQRERDARMRDTYQNVSFYAFAGLAVSVFFLVIIIFDFSKSQQYRRRLEAANSQTRLLLKNREQLISTVSHDLKTPVSTIDGYTEILSKSPLTPQQHYYLENIRKSSEYILNLTHDLGSLTQLEAGKIRLERQPFFLNQLLEETARSVASLHPTKPIELLFDFDPAFRKPVKSDPYRIRQIATNLIGNAFKFTAEGSITISTLREGGHMLFAIADTGIGIRKENLDRVFEEFTQEDDTIEERFGGTGLGLAISRKLALLLGGTIHLESAFGAGSRFTVRLPLAHEEEASARDDRPSSAHFVLSGKKAVAIDDDPRLLQLIGEVLRANGVTHQGFSSADEALAFLEHEKADFILTDIQMPGRDGFGFLNELKGRNIATDTPVIAVSGADHFDEDTFRNAGFAGVIRKPFTMTSLVESIGKILANPDVFQEGSPLPTDTYDASTIGEFFGGDQAELTRFMLGVADTITEDLDKAGQAIAEKDVQRLVAASHKMSSLFRQLGHGEAVRLLDILHEATEVDAEIATAYEALRCLTTTFVGEIRTRYTSSNP